MQKTLVLFDFDGTVTKSDTLPLFFKFTFGNLKFLAGFGLNVPLFICFKLGLITAEKFKKKILSFYLKNKQEEWIISQGRFFVDFLHTKAIIKPEFIHKINEYKKNGATVAIVSASIDIWIKPFCDQYNIQAICTEIEYTGHLFKGNLKTRNCNHEEKKNRVLMEFNLNDFNEIIVYGDSTGDNFLMELATQKNWI